MELWLAPQFYEIAAMHYPVRAINWHIWVMMNINDLVNAARFNVFLGKNGSGKSTILRRLDASDSFNTKYISPERGGTLKYDAGVDQNMSNNERWLSDSRRKNRFDQFRQQSAAQFRNLEMLVLREIEQDAEIRANQDITFDLTLERINTLLPKIRVRRADKGFEITTLEGDLLPEDDISSGEAELIALCIELLVFARSSDDNKVLLLDEPDVHLHPDLQQKYISFVESVAVEFDIRVAFATHSTAIIGAFSDGADMKIVPITDRTQEEFEPFGYDPICHQILPIFGAHPLSAQFNRSPVILVEGEDDRRVIDQVVRSGNGRYAFSPCVVGTVDEMNKWETWLDTYLPRIYDEPKGFSLRDLDNVEVPDLDDVGCVARARLNCYALENLLLTDECFAEYGTTPKKFLGKLKKWVEENPEHQATAKLSELVDTFDKRRTLKIKKIRNVVVALLETGKPWEIIVGQLIVKSIDDDNVSENALHAYLGEKAANEIFARKKNISRLRGTKANIRKHFESYSATLDICCR